MKKAKAKKNSGISYEVYAWMDSRSRKEDHYTYHTESHLKAMRAMHQLLKDPRFDSVKVTRHISQVIEERRSTRLQKSVTK